MEILNGKLKLYISVVPNSNSTRIKYCDDEEIKIEIDEPPENNKANVKLVRYLSKLFKVSKDKIVIIGGQTSRRKVVLIECVLSMEQAKDLLQSDSSM